MELAKLPPEIVDAICNLMKSWQTRIFLKTPTETIETNNVKYENGVLQGDCLAMMLFMLSINPLSHLLRNLDGYAAGPPGSRDTSTHLLFVDDLKTFDRGRLQAEEKLKVITQFTKDIGMNFGQEKCAYLNIERGKRKPLGVTIEINGLMLKELEDGDTYQYLGIEEDVSYRGQLNKNRVTQEYYARVRKIWRSNLNAINKVKAHNCFAMPILTPTFGIVDWSKSEVLEIDVKTRKLLTMLGAFHRNSDVDRLYVPRMEGGRGLCSALDMYYTRLVTLCHHLNMQSSDNEFIAKVCLHEKERLFKASQNLSTALEIPPLQVGQPTTNSISKAMKAQIKQKHASAWLQKSTHGYLHKKASTLATDITASNAWTNSRKLTSHVEGYVFAIQEQEIATRKLNQQRLGGTDTTAAICRHCHRQPEDISHIVGSCPSLAPSMYLPLRHNEVAKSLYHAILCSIDASTPFRSPESLTSLGALEIWWDMRVRTLPKVQHNKPDMIIWNRQLKECKIVEVGTPLDVNVAHVESEKFDKYMPLMLGLQRLYPEYRFQIIPIVIGATGNITKNLTTNLAKLGIQAAKIKSLTIQLQERSIMGTVKIVKSALGKSTNKSRN